ncbi:MAG: DUF2142 domain-containing protein [Bacteroidetes bacterium]|nr:DUF2142 domain-containing protein [Bacteroidota bacterium]
MLGILLAITYTVLFIFLIWKINFFRDESISRKIIVFVFLLKIVAGTILWLVYTRIYPDRLTADIFKYFDDGKVMYNALFSKPLDYFKMLLGIPDASLLHYYNDDMGHWTRPFNQGMYDENRTLIRFNALVDIFSFSNYHVHTVFICFLSLTGLMGIYKSFSSFLSNKKKELFAAIFLLPSVLFWGSGVLKEGLIVFFLGMVIYHYQKFIQEGVSAKRLCLVFIFLFLLSITKIYILLVLLPALIAHTWVVKTKNRFSEIKYAVVLIIYFSIGLVIPKYHFPFMLMEKQRQGIYMAQGGSYLGNQKLNKFVYIYPNIEKRIIRLKNNPGFCKIVPGIAYTSWNLTTHLDSMYVHSSSDTSTYWIFYDQPAAGSYIKIPLIEPTIPSIIKNAPLAFFNTAFRPHLLEAKNPLMIFSAIENIFILLFIFICMLFVSRKIQNRNMIYFCFSITVLLFALIGLTTPILGAVVRYKIPALPFFLITFLLLLDKEKLLHKFPFLKKFIG